MVQADLRFGIVVDGERSRTWRVRAGARKPELFIERETLEHAVHVSLHESGQWHLKHNDVPVVQWQRPAELAPGLTRAVAVVLPHSVAMFDDPLPSPTYQAVVTKWDENTPEFSIFIEQQGADLTSWPGRTAMNSEFVGRLPMADGTTCCVVLRRTPIDAGSLKFETTPERLEELKKRAAKGGTMMTLVANASDGAFVLIDMRQAKPGETV